MDQDLIDTKPLPIIGGVEEPEPEVKASASRGEIIRKLTRGKGVGYSSQEFGDQLQAEVLTRAETLRLFGPKLAKEKFVDLSAHIFLSRALAIMPDSNAKVAIESALGYKHSHKKNLTQRRVLAAKELGVSVRTLMRYEIEGAESLPYFLDLSFSWYHSQNPSRIAVADAEPDIEMRLLRLEALVVRLLEREARNDG